MSKGVDPGLTMKSVKNSRAAIIGLEAVPKATVVFKPTGQKMYAI